MKAKIWLTVGHWLFLIIAAGFAAWGLQGQWSTILDAISDVSLARWFLAMIAVLFGLATTGLVWTILLRGYGYMIPSSNSLPVFFVGQIGKYIPGSVWSFGAQAYLAGKFKISARASVAAGVLFLGWNISSAMLVGCIAVLSGALDIALPHWIFAIGVLLSGTAMVPGMVNWLGTRLAGAPQRLGWTESGILLLLMLGTWVSYGLALMSLGPHGEAAYSELPPLAAIGAFAIAYIAGVLVIFAPAGLGAREATLVLLLAPYVGVAPAAAVALLARVIHVSGDFAMAGLAWIIAQQADQTGLPP